MAENLEEGLISLKESFSKIAKLDDHKKQSIADFVRACVMNRNENLNQLARTDEHVLAFYHRSRHLNALDIDKIEACVKKIRNGEKLSENEIITPKEVAILRDIAFLKADFDHLNKLKITDKSFASIYHKAKRCAAIAEEFGLGPELNRKNSGSYGFFQSPHLRSLKEVFARLKMLDMLSLPVDNLPKGKANPHAASRKK